MNREPNAPHVRSGGFSLLWVIAAIVVVAALSVGLLSMTMTSNKHKVMMTFDTQARLLAQSGINYASNLAAEILAGNTNSPLTSLDGSVITTGLGPNQSITLSVTASGANPYDYEVTSLGTVNSGTTSETNYSVTNIINAPVSGTGVYIVQSKPGTAVASPTDVAVNASALNDYTAGISFDPRFAGSGHYNINAANFSGGVGSLLNGFRAYFTYSISSGSNADGFVFAIKNGTYNGPRNAGGPPAGVSHGSFLGYAGPGYPYWGNGLGIRPPKFGVEFDIYTNSGHSGGISSDGRNDPDNHHVANVYWGTTWNAENTPPSNTYATSSWYAWDDNVHNIGGANTKTDPAPFNPNSSPGLVSITRTNMVGTASPVPVRVEVSRPSAVYSTNSSNSHYNMYAYTIKMWHNCTAAACSDMTTDYGAAPTTSTTVYLTATTHAAFQFFVYGFQVSTGASTGQYTFSIPKLGMR